MKLDDYIKPWSERLGMSEEEIKKEYESVLKEESTTHKNLNEEERNSRALQRLAMTYKNQLRSPAIPFDGMIIGLSDCVDTVARIRIDAIKQFRMNPQQAISDGVVNDEGIPLDTRETWSTGNPNRNFGKPLPEHNWIRNVFGIASKKNIDEPPRYFTMTISGELAKNDSIPIFTPVSFRAVDRTSPEDTTNYNLNPSVFTEFKFDESIKLPQPQELINQFCVDNRVLLNDLSVYHTANSNDFNRLAIIEGDVSVLALNPTSTGNRRIVLDDETNLDLESQGTTCWIPPRINIDFEEQSKVIIVGRTSQGKKLDEQGNQTEELGDVMLNVYGIYAIPKYRVEKQDSPSEVKETPKETQTKVTDNW